MDDPKGDPGDDPGGDHRWLSYSQLSDLRGISRASAVRLCRKHRWRRRVNNEGVVTVAVPVAFTVPDRRAPGGDPSDHHGDAHRALVIAVEALKGENAALKGQVELQASAIAELRGERDQARAEAQDARQALDELRQADQARRADGRLRRVWRAWRRE